MVEPKCPSCEVVGTKNIVSKESDQQSGNGDAWFDIVHCSQCGYVYGVFAKTTFSPSPSEINLPSFD